MIPVFKGKVVHAIAMQHIFVLFLS
jgi:hypothetical protein